MAGPSRALSVTEDQVLWFRARRWHLAGPGARSAAEAARALVGAQAQQLPPALWALSQRMKSRPTAAALKSQMFEGPRTIVRAWGQRETLFVFEATEHWPCIASIRQTLAPAGRRGPMPAGSTVDRALRAFRASERTLCRSDLLGMAPAGYVKQLEPFMGPGPPSVRLAAGRLIWVLSLRGELCVADKSGAEQHYALRERWFPDLEWPDPYRPDQASEALTRDYFQSYGPATVQDLAHFFGARVSVARDWVAPLQKAGEITKVACGERKGLLALQKDARALRATPPSGTGEWAIRMLPLWEALLMGHADKSWTVPVEPERKRIWRKAAYVASVVLARGRAVAIWTMKERAKRLDVKIEPLQGWRARQHLPGVKSEARALAEHLGEVEARVGIESSLRA